MEDIKAIDVMNYPYDPELVKIWWEGSPEMRLMKDTMFKGKIRFIMCSTDEFIERWTRRAMTRCLSPCPECIAITEGNC